MGVSLMFIVWSSANNLSDSAPAALNYSAGVESTIFLLESTIFTESSRKNGIGARGRLKRRPPQPPPRRSRKTAVYDEASRKVCDWALPPERTLRRDWWVLGPRGASAPLQCCFTCGAAFNTVRCSRPSAWRCCPYVRN